MITPDDFEYMEEIDEGEIDREFCDYLDDARGLVNVAGFDYLTSQVLYDTDPIAWQEMRSEWLDSAQRSAISAVLRSLSCGSYRLHICHGVGNYGSDVSAITLNIGRPGIILASWDTN